MLTYITPMCMSGQKEESACLKYFNRKKFAEKITEGIALFLQLSTQIFLPHTFKVTLKVNRTHFHISDFD